MRTKSWTSWPRRRAVVGTEKGLTLVEVLAGTALLGALLVSILLAKHRLTVQGRRAEMRLAACRVLEGLLSEWWTSPEGVPRDGTGEVTGDRGAWRWRTRVDDAADTDALDAEIVVVELFEAAAPSRVPAATVELLLPLAETKP